MQLKQLDAKANLRQLFCFSQFQMFVFIKTISIIHLLITNSLLINFMVISKHYAMELITKILVIKYCFNGLYIGVWCKILLEKSLSYCFKITGPDDTKVTHSFSRSTRSNASNQHQIELKLLENFYYISQLFSPQ